jgi:hypothetical protein
LFRREDGKMKIDIECWTNDSAEEWLINQVAQEFYSEAWEFIERLTHDFRSGLYIIAGRTLTSVIENSKKYKGGLKK